MLREDQRSFGVIADPVTKEYIRWTKLGTDAPLILAIVDCYRYAGVKRVELPMGPRIKSMVRGARTRFFWKENYDYSGTEVWLGVPVHFVQDLTEPLPEEIALRVSGGFERLEDFIQRYSGSQSTTDSCG